VVTVAAHFLAAAALGIFVFLHPVPEREPEILDVSLETDLAPAAAGTKMAAAPALVNPVPEELTEKTETPAKTEPQKSERTPKGATGSVSTAANNAEAVNGSGSQNVTGATGNGTGTAVAKPAGPPPGTLVPVTRPYQVSGGAPAYPESARARGIQGTVYVRALISTTGAVTSASVSGSSGNGELDRAAVNAVYGWGFSPARDRYGAKCQCYISVPVSFRLR
jgi:protein TonB